MDSLTAALLTAVFGPSLARLHTTLLNAEVAVLPVGIHNRMATDDQTPPPT